jgi:hypothetical protein
MYRILFATALLAGCTTPNDTVPDDSLATAVKVSALGVRGPSDIMVHQQGTLDPAGHDMRVSVVDVQGTIRTPSSDGGPLIIDSLTITLDDVDYPPSPQMPDGLKLREQHLVAAQPIEAQVYSRGPNGVGATTMGALEYHTVMLMPDGTRWPLGKTQMSSDQTRVQIAKTEGGVQITFDSSAGGQCGALGDLLTLSDCSLFVEADGVVTPLGN